MDRTGDSQANTIPWLPPELWLLIFANLPVANISALSLVCKDWHGYCQDDVLWRQYFCSRFQHAVCDSDGSSWKKRYQMYSSDVLSMQSPSFKEFDKSSCKMQATCFAGQDILSVCRKGHLHLFDENGKQKQQSNIASDILYAVKYEPLTNAVLCSGRTGMLWLGHIQGNVLQGAPVAINRNTGSIIWHVCSLSDVTVLNSYYIGCFQ